MVRLARLLLPLLVCSSMTGAILPGQRISEPLRLPSAHGQSAVALASRGAGAFAVWNDHRLPGYGSLFGTRLGADGTVLDPTGILIDEAYGEDPAIVWNGWDYTAIAGETPSSPYAIQRLFLYRIDADGKLIQRRVPAGSIDAPRLATNLAGDIAIGGHTYAGGTVSFFDRETRGSALAVTRVGDSWGGPVPVADQRDWFAFAEGLVCQPKNVNCKVVLDQFSFDANRAVAKKTTLFDFERDPWTLSAASNGAGRFAMAWIHTETIDREKEQYKRRLFYAVTDRDGRVLAGPYRIERTEIDVDPLVSVWGNLSADLPHVTWTGESFVVSWKWFDGTGATGFHAIRVDPAGNRLEPAPIAFSSASVKHIHHDTEPAFVKTDSHLIAAWGAETPERNGFVFGVVRAVQSFGELTMPKEPLPLTSSLIEQGGVQIAASDDGVLAVWLENNQTWGRFLPLTGRAPDRIAISTASARRAYMPAVASGGGVFLAVWHEAEMNPSGFPIVDRVFLRRFDRQGIALDAAPVLLATEGFHDGAYMPHMEIDIGFDGTRFLAVWSGVNDGGVHGVRIPPSGKPVDGLPLALSKPGSVRTGGPQLAWTGNEYVLTFYEDATPSSNGGAPLPILPHLGRMTRVSAEGKVLDPSYPAVITIRGGFDLYRSAFEPSWNGREVLVTWAVLQTTFAPLEGCAYAQRFTPAGQEIDAEPVLLMCQSLAAGFSSHMNPRPLWDGSRWWLFYSKATSDGGIFVAPLKGASFDGPPARLLDRTTRPGAADALFTPAGLVFAYTAADEKYGRVTGVFWSRVISPRSRAVRN